LFSEGGAIDFSYSNKFTCIPDFVPFRPPRMTRRPVIDGTQTAIVVGPPGEEIYTDEHGRVKVQFHWDREGKYDQNSSCWIRVSHPWAGKGWGAMAIPRIGQEVIVAFEAGDPDRPVIVGRLYNAEQTPPYPLPSKQNVTSIKSYSTKGGGGFNELRLDDTKGSEQYFTYAQKDQHCRVKEKAYEYIGIDSHLIVGKDEFSQIKGDQHCKIVGDRNEQVDGAISLKVGTDLQQKVGMKCAVDAGMEIHLKAGMNVVIESGTSLTLKVGGNFINLSPAGIAISGMPMVLINSGGAAGSGSGCSPDPPKPPEEACTAEGGTKAAMPPPKQPPVPSTYSPQASVLTIAAKKGTPFCEVCGF
jgi:type VI secretion system secreted protein VgrG